MTGIDVLSRTQRIVVSPSTKFEVLHRTQRIIVTPRAPAAVVEVVSTVQRIMVTSHSSVSVTNSGPVGPPGVRGLPGLHGDPGLQGIPGPPSNAGFQVVVVTTSATAAFGQMVKANAVSSGFSITLPPPQEGVIRIKKVDSTFNPVTIFPNGGLIEGAADFVLVAPGVSIDLLCDGTDWEIT